MKKATEVIAILLILMQAARAQDQERVYDARECIEVIKTEFKEGGCLENGVWSGEFYVYVQNNCDKAVKIRIAIKKTNGTWDAGANSKVNPGEKWKWRACYPSLNGEYEIQALWYDDYKTKFTRDGTNGFKPSNSNNYSSSSSTSTPTKIPSYEEAMQQKRIQEQQAEEKRQRQIAENQQNAANFHKELVAQNNSKYSGNSNTAQSSSEQYTTNSQFSNQRTEEQNRQDAMDRYNRSVAASNAWEQQTMAKGDVAISQLSNAVGDIFAADQRQYEARQAEAAERRAEAAEERRIEEGERRVEEEKSRINGLQQGYISSLTEIKWPKSYESYSEDALYFYAVTTKNTTVMFSNIFIIEKASDGSWPYKSDLDMKIAKNIEPGSQMQLMGYFRTYNEAVAHQDQQLILAQKSYLSTGTFKTQLGITSNNVSHSATNNDSFDNPWDSSNSSESEQKQTETNQEKDFDNPW